MLLVWKDEYSIGVKLIDDQHKYLFEIGNSAYKLLRDGAGKDQYADAVLIIDDLLRYTRFHFKTEEDYMIKINYNDYLSQKAEHNEFIEKINNINLEQVQEDPQKHIEDILAFIFNWLLSHIVLKDKLIKEY